jgi:hypothetical protein
MKRIILINPAYRTKLLENVRVLALPLLNLLMLAAYTLPDFSVEILDEAFSDIN